VDDKVRIKVTVSGRNYPLIVTPNEEEHIRKAVAFIEERTMYLEKKYAIKDIQDLQALMLIELASELSFIKSNQEKKEQLIEEKINQLLQI
jgi:cell division protein ZapA (FtsZ GTPase activity inhibitor)